MHTGIDVHHAKGRVDWMKLKSKGFDFAFIKATEGDDFNDSRYRQNFRDGTQAGLKMAPYHFARPTDSPARAQADHFMDMIGIADEPIRGGETVYEWCTRTKQLPAWLDIEDGKGISAVTLTTWCEDFITRMRLSGWGVGIYSYPNFVGGVSPKSFELAPSDVLAALPYWGADYDQERQVPRTGWFKKWDVWQHSSSGSLPGIVSGRVDMNRMNLKSPLNKAWGPVDGVH